MNFNRITNRVSQAYLSDPYAALIAYRRCIKVISGIKSKGLSILVIGNRSRFPESLKLGSVFLDSIDESTTSSIGPKYGLVICLDPIYLKYLKCATVPVMVAVKSAECILPDIFTTDYILPLSSTEFH